MMISNKMLSVFISHSIKYCCFIHSYSHFDGAIWTKTMTSNWIFPIEFKSVCSVEKELILFPLLTLSKNFFEIHHQIDFYSNLPYFTSHHSICWEFRITFCFVVGGYLFLSDFVFVRSGFSFHGFCLWLWICYKKKKTNENAQHTNLKPM